MNSCKNINLDDLNHSEFALNQNETSRWLLPDSKPTSVILVAHGLTAKPSSMLAIAETLRQQGAATLLVALYGHRGSFDENQAVTREKWINHLFDHYCHARTTFPNLPVYAVGHSLGGLILNDLMLAKPEVEIEKQVLIAPALRLKWYTKIAESITKNKEGSLPSKNLPEYRIFDRTSYAAYRGLFASRDFIKNQKYKLKNIPTIVFIDLKDELVSFLGIERQIKLQSEWTLVPVSNQHTSLKKSYHHLIVDEATMGTDQWLSFQSGMNEHLFK